MSKTLRIIFAGTPDFAARHLDALLSSGHQVVGVFTQPDRPAGRGKKLMPSPVKVLAEEHGLPVFQPASLRPQENQQLVADLNRHASSRGKYEIYQEQIKNTEKQIGHYAQMKASLYQDYSEGLLTEADYITVGQDYARKMDDLKIFMASLSRDALKYAPEYTGSEKWAKRVEAFQQQEQLSREMVEAFIDMITVYEDGRTEVAFRNMDELEAVLYQASERRKEDMRYAV